MSEQSAGVDKSAQLDIAQAAALARSYLDSLRAADVAGAYKVAAGALDRGMTLAALYQRVIAPAMHELGRLWAEGAITVADEHLATGSTHRVLAALRPPGAFAQVLDPQSDAPLALLAAVPGERHALGLRMAADLLEDRGYQVAYLGADVPAEALLQAIDTLSPRLLGLSATMPESSRRLEAVVEAVRSGHPRLPLLLGGQASRSPRLREGTLLDDLEQLEEKVPLPS